MRVFLFFLRKDIVYTFLQCPSIQISFSLSAQSGIRMLSYLPGIGSFSDVDAEVLKVFSVRQPLPPHATLFKKILLSPVEGI